METKIQRPSDLFYANVQYEVPLFQRPYVWDEDHQWSYVWEDISTHAESIIRGEEPRPHFLGAVVLQQTMTMPGSITKFLVIDGQQRLLTLQLLMHAVRCGFRSHGYDVLDRQIGNFTQNDEDFVDNDVDSYVIWPTNVDREAYRAAMRASSLEDISKDYIDSKIFRGFLYFLDMVTTWLDAPDSEDRARSFAKTLQGGIEFVSIVLQSSENPQQIFETLNARGTPLSAVDLIKNFVFQNLEGDLSIKTEAYEKYWTNFENTFWTQEISVGRLTMQRSSLFFSHWLASKLKRISLASEVFSDFKRLVAGSNLSISSILPSITKVANEYQTYAEDSIAGKAAIELLPTFIYRLDSISASTLTPLIIWLIDPDRPKVPTAQLRIAIKSLESWIVRRHIVRAATKGYNRFVVDVIGELEAVDRNVVGSTLEAILRRQDADTTYWPSDEMIETILLNFPVYKLISKNALRMILEAVEDFRRGYPGDKPRHEQPLERRVCNIEHVMPQKWQSHWSNVYESDIGFDRDNLVNFIGNLTLVTKSLNSSLSNAPWEGANGKRTALENSTSILLTREVLEMGKSDWNGDLILERSKRLLEDIVKIWPSPTYHRSAEFIKVPAPTASAEGSSRPSIATLIKLGLLVPGQILYPVPQKYAGRNCVVDEMGSLAIDNKAFATPSAAGKVASGLGSVNGWTFWSTSPRSKVTLDDLWNEYKSRA